MSKRKLNQKSNPILTPQEDEAVDMWKQGLLQIAGPVGFDIFMKFIGGVIQKSPSDPTDKSGHGLWLSSSETMGYPVVAELIVQNLLPIGGLSGILVRGDKNIPDISDTTSLVVLVDFPVARIATDVVPKIPRKTDLLIMCNVYPPSGLDTMFNRKFDNIVYCEI